MCLFGPGSIYVYKTDDASQIIDARHVNTAQGSADRLSALLYSTPCTKCCGEYSSLNTEHSVFACIYAYSVQYVSVCVCVFCAETRTFTAGVTPSSAVLCPFCQENTCKNQLMCVRDMIHTVCVLCVPGMT